MFFQAKYGLRNLILSEGLCVNGDGKSLGNAKFLLHESIGRIQQRYW